MTRDITIGIISLGFIFVSITYLVLRSRNIINKISERGADTARKITKEINV